LNVSSTDVLSSLYLEAGASFAALQAGITKPKKI